MRQTAHIEGEVEFRVEPGSFEVNWSENQISVHYADETSILPLNEKGLIDDRAEKFIAASHTDELIDMAGYIYEEHCRLMEEA